VKPAEGGAGTNSAATKAKTLFYTHLCRKRNLPLAELIEAARNPLIPIAFAEFADED